MKCFEYKQWFAAIFLINFLINLGFCMSDAFFSVYFSEIGATSILIGVAAASYQISKIVSSRYIGATVLRYGFKSILFYSLIIYGAVAASLVFIQDLYLIIFIKILQGIACASFRPIVYGMLNSKVNSNSLCKGRSFSIFDISFYAALALGPCIGGVIKEYLGFQWLFVILFAICASALTVCKYFIIDDQFSYDNRCADETPAGISRTECALYMFIVGKAVMLACITIYFPIFLIKENHLNSLQAGFVLAFPATVTSLSLKPMGKLADSELKHIVVFLGGILASVTYLFFPLVKSFYGAVLFTALCGFFSAMSQPASVTLLLRNTPPNHSVTAIGRMNSVMGIGYAAGAFQLSILTVYFPINDVFISAGVIGLVSMIAFLFINNSKSLIFNAKWFAVKQ